MKAKLNRHTVFGTHGILEKDDWWERVHDVVPDETPGYYRMANGPEYYLKAEMVNLVKMNMVNK